MTLTARTPRRVLIASDSFKGTLDSLGVGEALAAGWNSISPHDEIEIIAVGDGGEGTLEALHRALPESQFERVRSLSPQGETRDARWLKLDNGVAVVELAEICGLLLTDPLQPLTAHTQELGRVIAATLDAGMRRVLVAIGGSASTDGGVGMLTALGARFYDAQGRQIALGGAGLCDLHHIDVAGLRSLPEGGVTALVDVTSPLYGPHGAAHVFGPQKGATPEMVKTLDAGLRKLATFSGAEPDIPGAGAAGGTGYALSMWGATFEPGAQAVAQLLRLRERVAASDVVITGEGAFDSQTEHGKFPAMLRTLANEESVPVMLVAGAINAEPAGFAAALSLTQLAGGTQQAVEEPGRWIEIAGMKFSEFMNAQGL